MRTPLREFPMRSYLPLLLLALPLACTNANNESVEIVFALESFDEIQVPTPGQPCYYTPVIQAGGFYKTSGELDVDPNVNSSPEYLLALQVENYMDQTILTDSNGNPLSGPQRNDFHVNDVIVQYVTDPGNSWVFTGQYASNGKTVTLPGAQPLPQADYTNCPTKGVPCGRFLGTGDVPAQGMQGATAVIVDTVSSDVIRTLKTNLYAATQSQDFGNTGIGEVLLEIYMDGTLSSGESIRTGVFNFPLTVCWDCDESPLKCTFGYQTPSPDTHGPCCANQDFGSMCVNCGYAGEPCCELPPTLPCQQQSDCAAYGQGFANWQCAGGNCACTVDADCAMLPNSTCNKINGQCAPGCQTVATGSNSTATLTCQTQLTLPIGEESCPTYPTNGAMTEVCATAAQ